MLAESITVTTVGLGDGADGDLLRMIAESGGGRYHYAPDPNSLPRIFTREAEMISRQADVQDWFPVVQTRSADFLKGVALASAPLLHGYVATQMKGPPAEQILATETGDPILARWRVGLGYSLAWTSDVKNNWAVDWLRWGGFSQFWGQLVREHMRKKSHRELDMRTSLVGNTLTATVDAFTSSERFENGLSATLTVKGAAKSGSSTQYPMPQTAPGRYEAQIPLREYGTFSLNAEYVRESEDGTLKRVGDSHGYVSNPYPVEYQSFEPDATRLELVARTGNGSRLSTPNSVFDPAGESVRHQTELWSKAVFAALILFLLDLLVRRVRIFDRDFRGSVSPL
jgi:Ca-activated chloride channel family protein